MQRLAFSTGCGEFAAPAALRGRGCLQRGPETSSFQRAGGAFAKIGGGLSLGVRFPIAVLQIHSCALEITSDAPYRENPFLHVT
jgi:hypothetical protein